MVPLSCLCEALLLIPSTDKTQIHLFALSENTKYVKSELFGAKNIVILSLFLFLVNSLFQMID